MRLALAEARRARGRSFPNPPVGAVVFRGGQVLGRGHTRPPGGPHAEVVALERARRRHGPRRLRGASLAVTLEPCAHHGRTGPCADLVARSGVRRVLVGHADPHPEVAGRGLARLRRAGLEVRVGVLEAECREQHRGFLSVLARGRPFVVLKLAASLDGRIATPSGESRWISGAEARARVHRLRARVDAVAVGAGTALADDPELTARAGGRVTHRPVRVLWDSLLRVPRRSRLYQGGIAPTWVLCSRAAPAARRREALAAGARLLAVPARRGRAAGGRLDLRRALAALARAGLTELLVEGGGELAAGLLREGLVDELHWFSAPILLGGDARPAVGPLRLAALAQAVAIEDLRVRRAGRDLHLSGRPRRPDARARRAAKAAP